MHLVDRASSYIICLSDTDGSRTVLLLAPERLEIVFSSSSLTYGRRKEATTLPPPPETTAEAKGWKFLLPEMKQWCLGKQAYLVTPT